MQEILSRLGALSKRKALNSFMALPTVSIPLFAIIGTLLWISRKRFWSSPACSISAELRAMHPPRGGRSHNGIDGHGESIIYNPLPQFG